MFSHHHQGAMKSEIITWTEGSKIIKDLMLELYRNTLNYISPVTGKHDTQAFKDASPFYSRIIVENYMEDGVIASRHAHNIIGKVPEDLLVTYKDKAQVLASKLGGMADLSIVTREINYNDHFLFELMTELMVKAGLGLQAAALEIRRIILNHGKSSYLADDEFFQLKLKEIAKPGEENDKHKRQISDLELDYSLDRLRLDTVDALMKDGSSADEAFDIVCKAEGQEMKAIVAAEKVKRHERLLEKRKAEAEAEADGVERAEAGDEARVEKARKAAQGSQVIESKKNAETEARKKNTESLDHPVAYIRAPAYLPAFETQIPVLPRVVHHHNEPNDMMNAGIIHSDRNEWLPSNALLIPLSVIVLLTLAAAAIFARPISRCLKRNGIFATPRAKPLRDDDRKHENQPLMIETADATDSGTESGPSHSRKGEPVHRRAPGQTLITFLGSLSSGEPLARKNNRAPQETVREAAVKVTGSTRFTM
jgi:hypothetical protein